MAESPAALLQKLAECAIELTGAESAGVSLLEPDGADGEFRWAATAGEFFPFLGGKMPRNFSPCGTVLDRNATVLMTDPARFYPYVANFKPRIEEVLLIPFYQSRKPIGTVWVIAHSRARKFDAEDVRLITSVSKFASVAVNALSGSIAHDSLLRKVATQARVFDTTLSAITDFAYIVDRDCRFV
ncbi:MAG TPA: GAF domain-containing protein, partial [Tepidisphaeraceae bacterium]|nr:GAF domain-containing protein [Tepidisphaeraceae bacterium]